MAIRSLIRQKRRSLIIAATAVVGMTAVTAAQGFINGFTVSMIQVAVNSGLGHVQIRPKGYLDSRQMDTEYPESPRLKKVVAANLPENVNYAPRMEREAILRLGSETRGVLILGIEPSLEPGVSEIPNWPVTQGSFLKTEAAAESEIRGNRVPCMIGEKMSRILETETGGRVILSTGSRNEGAKSFVCRVTGIFRSPSSSLEEYLVLMHLADIAFIRNDGPSDEIGYFVLRGTDTDQSQSIAEHFRNILKNEKGTEVASLSDLEPLLADLITLYDSVSWVFYFVILTGFGLILFISVTMSIFERLQEIGIMHAIGARPFFLFRLITLESALITIAGTFSGLIPGTLLVIWLYHTGFHFSADTIDTQSWGASSMDVVHPFLTMQDYLESTSVALLIGLISSVYPAWKAVKVSPLEAIHRK